MAYVKHALLKAQGIAMSEEDMRGLSSTSRISRRQMVGDSIENNAVCSAVLEVDGLTGTIKGSRWSLTGSLPSAFRIKASRLFKEFGDAENFILVKLPKLDLFKFSSESTTRNFSRWMSMDTIMEHGEITVGKKNTQREARDLEAMKLMVPGLANGLSARVLLLPKQVGTMIISVQLVPMNEDLLRTTCSKFGKELSDAYVPALKPCLVGRSNMAFASYKPVEPAGKGWGMAHLPHLELFVGEEQEITWPCPKLMVWELFELHKACIYAKSASSCVETLLDENWNDSIVSLPDGANRWPNAPDVVGTTSNITGKHNVFTSHVNLFVI